MTREEAIKRLSGILAEAVEFENSVCYVTEEDREPLEMAIKALEQEPCDDAISRQAYIERYRKWGYSEYGRKVDNEALAIRVAMSLPPVTPQPKTGHWKDCGEREPWYRCSECGRRVWGGANHYCPDCGAKMGSEDKE